MIKKIIIYFVILLISLLPAIYINNLAGYIPFLFMLFTTVFSFGYTFILSKSYSQLEASEAESCVRDTAMEFKITVSNKSFLIFPRITAYFYISDAFGKEASVTSSDFGISSYEKKTFSFDVKFEHIGTYKVGLKSIEIHDLFNFLSLNCKNKTDNNLFVTPKLFDVEGLEIKNSQGLHSTGSASKSKIEETDYSGVREYVPGDAIKNIHWKLSAHTVNYMTRTFDNFSSNGISVYINFYVPDYPNDILMPIYDCIVESAYSIANYALEMDQEVELIYENSDAISIVCPKDFPDLKEAVLDFPLVSAENSNSLSQVIASHAFNAMGLDNIMVCTSTLDRDLTDQLISCRNMGKYPVLFYIEPKHYSSNLINANRELLSFLAESGIDYYIITSAADIQMAVGV